MKKDRGFTATWQLREAKTKFSELIEQANSKGPQIIVRNGTECAVVLSMAEYKALCAHTPGLRAYLLGGPRFDDFEVQHETDTGREVDL